MFIRCQALLDYALYPKVLIYKILGAKIAN